MSSFVSNAGVSAFHAPCPITHISLEVSTQLTEYATPAFS